MSQEKWAVLRGWLRRVFGPAEGSELFYDEVLAARAMGAECPCELCPGF